MANFRDTPHQFISQAFLPMVGVLASEAVELVCEKNNLSFVELIEPFASLPQEIQIRDPSNAVHNVKDFKLSFHDLTKPTINSQTIKKKLNDLVFTSYQLPQQSTQSYDESYFNTNSANKSFYKNLIFSSPNNQILKSGKLSFNINTPWYEEFRNYFFESLSPTDHEFLKHYVACILAVSTDESDPMDQVNKMLMSNLPPSHPIQSTNSSLSDAKWFSNNVLIFIVLVHDVNNQDDNKAEFVYQKMKQRFGANHCHLLHINSQTPRPIVKNLDGRINVLGEHAVCIADTPAQVKLEKLRQYMDGQEQVDLDNVWLLNALNKQIGNRILWKQVKQTPEFSHTLMNPSIYTNTYNVHPLENKDVDVNVTNNASNKTSSSEHINSVENNNSNNNNYDGTFKSDVQNINETSTTIDASNNNPLINMTDVSNNASSDMYINKNSTQNNSNKYDSSDHGHSTHSSSSSTSVHSDKFITPSRVSSDIINRYIISNKKIGGCLTESDLNRIRIFVSEFTIHALFPWVERTLRSLSETASTRKGIKGSLFSASKWFRPKQPTAPSQNTTATVVYSSDSPEMQLRRLADLAFLFHLYDLSYSTYHKIKSDFGNDGAWIHAAGSFEMACLSMFLQNTPSVKQQYPFHYMDQAIKYYYNNNRFQSYAARTTMMSTEILKSNNNYVEAANQFMSTILEESDLLSALFLEQTALCFLRVKGGMTRKYAFHMVFAGHRFIKAGQRKHALRCYASAYNVLCDKHWSLAEDHIHCTIGLQSFHVKEFFYAGLAFQHLLSSDSKQTLNQQITFFSQYFNIYRQQINPLTKKSPLKLFSIPQSQHHTIKVLVYPAITNQNTLAGGFPESGMTLADNDLVVNNSEFSQMEERLQQLTAELNNNSYLIKPSNFLYTQQTDNSSRVMAFVDEPVCIEVSLYNPLLMPLKLLHITPEWQTISNAYASAHSVVNVVSQEANLKYHQTNKHIHSNAIPEFVLAGKESKKLQLKIWATFHSAIKVTGISFRLKPLPPSAPNKPNTDKQEELATTSVTSTIKLDEDQLSNSPKKRGVIMTDEDVKETQVRESFKPETQSNVKEKVENTFLIEDNKGQVAHNVERKNYPLFKIEKDLSGDDSDKDAQVLKILQERDELQRSHLLGRSSSSYTSTSHSSGSSSESDDDDDDGNDDACVEKFKNRSINNNKVTKKNKKPPKILDEKAREREKLKILKHRQRLEDKIDKNYQRTMKKQMEKTSPTRRKSSGHSDGRELHPAFDSQPEWALDISVRKKMLEEYKASLKKKKKHAKDTATVKKNIVDKDSLSIESSSGDEEYYKRYNKLKALKKDDFAMPLNKEELESSIPAKVDFKLQGKRLNDKKDDRSQVLYALDQRLNIEFLPCVVKMRMNLYNIPQMLLCGQVTTFTLEFVNIGFKTIRTIYLTFNKPELFSLVLKPLKSRVTTISNNILEDVENKEKIKKEEISLQKQDLNIKKEDSIKNAQTLGSGLTNVKVSKVEEWLEVNTNKKNVTSKEDMKKPIPPFRDPKIVYSLSSCGTLLTGKDQGEQVLDYENIFIESDEYSDQSHKNVCNNNNNNNNDNEDDTNTNVNNAARIGPSSAVEREYGTVPGFPEVLMIRLDEGELKPGQGSGVLIRFKSPLKVGLQNFNIMAYYSEMQEKEITFKRIKMEKVKIDSNLELIKNVKPKDKKLKIRQMYAVHNFQVLIQPAITIKASAFTSALKVSTQLFSSCKDNTMYNNNNVVTNNNNDFDEVNLNNDNNICSKNNKRTERGKLNKIKNTSMDHPKWSPNLLQRAADVELFLDNSSSNHEFAVLKVICFSNSWRLLTRFDHSHYTRPPNQLVCPHPTNVKFLHEVQYNRPEILIKPGQAFIFNVKLLKMFSKNNEEKRSEIFASPKVIDDDLLRQYYGGSKLHRFMREESQRNVNRNNKNETSQRDIHCQYENKISEIKTAFIKKPDRMTHDENYEKALILKGLLDANKCHFSLVVVWRATSLDIIGRKPHYGHTVLNINKPSELVVSPLDLEPSNENFTHDVPKNVVSFNKNSFIGSTKEYFEELTKQKEVMTSLATASFNCPSKINHDFFRRKSLVVPLQVDILNLCDMDLVVLFEALQPSSIAPTPIRNSSTNNLASESSFQTLLASLSAASKQPYSPYLSDFIWLGRINTSFILRASKSSSLKLHAKITKAGIYDLSNVKLYVCPLKLLHRKDDVPTLDPDDDASSLVDYNKQDFILQNLVRSVFLTVSASVP